jgi:hypothetical protein
MKRIMQDLERFTAAVPSKAPRLQSLLLVGASGKICVWAAAEASANGAADYVHFLTYLDLLSEGDGGDEVRASCALIERFVEAREMAHSLLVLEDIDQLCVGSGSGGYSSIMIATLRALLQSPPASSSAAKAGGQSTSKRIGGKTIHILAATSRSDDACVILHELFDETIGRSSLLVASAAVFLLVLTHVRCLPPGLQVVPLLTDTDLVQKLLSDGVFPGLIIIVEPMADLIIDRPGNVGCKTALRLAERLLPRQEEQMSSRGKNF